jgi:hypothetical protein
MITILSRSAFTVLAGLVSLALLPLALGYLLHTMLVYRDHPATAWSSRKKVPTVPHHYHSAF